MTESSSWFRARRLGRYQIRGELGQGAFGSVFRAYDPQLNREVAIKLLVREDARSAARFAREVQAAAKLRHPNIASVHESGEYRGRPFLVMEYVDGDDLEALATAERRLSVSRAVEIVRDAARAIQHAHDQDVLHRDIKPQNILVDRSGQAQVVDFGLASLRDAASERLSHTGLPLGTPAFMAPEQMRGEKVDEQADVFGLGGTLYFSLCGQPPRGDGISPFASAVGKRIEPPSKIDPRVPRALDAICLKALHSDPWERHEGALDLADALDEFLAGGAGPKGRASSGSRLALPLLALAITVLGGLLAMLVTRRLADPTPASGTPTAAATPSTPLAARAPDVSKAESTLTEALALARRLGSTETIDHLFTRAESEAAGLSTLQDRIRLARIRHDFNRAKHADLLAHSAALAARADPLGLEVRLMRAITLFRLDRDDEAKALAEALVSADPKGAFGSCARGYLTAMLHSDHAKTLEHARQALGRDPDNHYAVLQQALSLTNLGRYDEALTHYRRFTRSPRRDDVHGYLGLAVTLLNRNHEPGSNESGSKELDRAIATAFELLSPRVTSVALRTRGQARLFTGRVEEALPDLQRAHELRPGDATLLVLLGMGHDRLEHHDEAHDAFSKAYKTDKETILRVLHTTRPRSLQARIRMDLGLPARTPPEVTATMKAYVKERLGRVSPTARPALGRAYRLMQEGHSWTKVKPEFNAAREAAPQDAALAYCDAEAALGRGKGQRALNQVRRARRLGMKGLELDFLEAAICWRMAERTRGRQLFTRITKADPASVLGRSAQAHLDWQADAVDRALITLQDLARREPPHLPSVVLLSIVLRERNRLAEANTVANTAAARIGFLDPWPIAQAALIQLALAVRGRGDQAKVDRAFLFASNTMLATSEPSLRLMAANFACEHTARAPKSEWAKAASRWLHDLRKLRNPTPEPFLLSGWLELLRGRPADAVLRHWAKARGLGVRELPPALKKAFRSRFDRDPF